MNKQNNLKEQLSRRRFIGFTAAATVYSVIPPIITGCTPKSAKVKPDSTFGGVPIGAITYSFRDLPGKNAEETLDYLLKCGLSHCELMSGPLEKSAGAPTFNMREMFPERRPGGPPGGDMDSIPRGNQRRTRDSIPGGGRERPEFEMPPEMREAMKKMEKEVSEWRKSQTSMTRFREIRDLYNKAGVKIHIVKFDNIGGDAVSDVEHDYMFKVAKTMGAKGITTELDENKAKKLGVLAKEYGIAIGFHNHTQLRPTTYSEGPYFSYGKSIMANLDIGHYAAGNGKSALLLVEELAKQKRILSIHLKDRTFGGDTVPFGEGDAQVAEILQLIQKNKWNINCDIELEYPVPEDSDPLKETTKCVEFCRNILS
jgi:sugar phosphate isomerase/epimerase